VVNARAARRRRASPAVPYPVTIKGIFSTNSDPVNSTPTVILALQMFVMSGIYRGIKKDTTEANRIFEGGASDARARQGAARQPEAEAGDRSFRA
jgi:hypothetical protein